MDASIDDGLAIEEAAFARIVPTHDAQEGSGGLRGKTFNGKFVWPIAPQPIQP